MSGEPLVLQQVGSRWEVYLDVDAARRKVGRYKSGPNRFLDRFPAGSIVVVTKKPSGGLDLVPGGSAHRFATKDEAVSAAHQIGYRALDLGSFWYSYTRVAEKKAGGTRRRTSTAKQFRGRAGKWFARRDRRRRKR